MRRTASVQVGQRHVVASAGAFAPASRPICLDGRCELSIPSHYALGTLPPNLGTGQ